MKHLQAIVLIVGVLFSAGRSIAQTSQPPLSTNLGLGQGAPGAGGFEPGDAHGSVGRTYIVDKVNNAIQFTNRSTGNISETQDFNFWPVSFGGVGFVPGGDARVLYDPYGPAGCATGGGRWIVTELGRTCAGSTCTAGFVLGVSTGEDPTPVAGNWSFSFLPATQGTPTPDQPKSGFNTNWIAVQVDFWDGTNPALFVWPKQSAECGGNLTDSSMFSAPLDPTTGWSPLLLAVPAETYYTSGQDLDGSTLYIINSGIGLNQTGGSSVCLSSITGTPQNPQFNPSISCPSEASSAWSSQTPDVAQKGTSTKINLSHPLSSDRITAAVVRNYGIWATHHVGLPASSPTKVVTQWWNIGVDSYLAGC